MAANVSACAWASACVADPCLAVAAAVAAAARFAVPPARHRYVMHRLQRDSPAKEAARFSAFFREQWAEGAGGLGKHVLMDGGAYAPWLKVRSRRSLLYHLSCSPSSTSLLLLLLSVAVVFAAVAAASQGKRCRHRFVKRGGEV